MDPDKRIEQLEDQVQRLTEQLRQLVEGQRYPQTALDHEPDHEAEDSPDSSLVSDMRQRVDRAFKVKADETIESRIGAVWLSRVAVVVTMTAFALAARATFWSEAIGPAEKVLFCCLLSGAFMAYGFFSRKGKDIFTHPILGCGLAGLYFTTYAAFFIDQMKIIHTPWLAIPPLFLCLLFLAGVAHWKKSQTIAGISLFLAYYTVALSCTQQPTSLESILYALITCTALAIVTLAFHAAHRWMLFTWAALITTHATYIFFFLKQPAGLHLEPNLYFWISNGFLTVCFILFSLTCIVDARKTGEYRRMVAPMSGVNSAIFLILTYWAVRDHYPQEQWMFRLAVAGLMLLFAIFAETTGPRRNYLFQIFIAKTVIMLTLALQAYLSDSGEKLLVAMSVECLALAISYKRSGIVVFKVLGLLLMAITFTGCLASVKMQGAVALWGYLIPANWFCAIGVVFFFQITAWFYEKFVRGLRPEMRLTSGQWFLADSMMDLHNASMAVIHAAAGALILLTITIMDRGGDPALPYWLGGEALVMAGLGLILFTPQTEIASVLLLAAAHVCYYVFLFIPPAGFETFEQQPHYALYTLLLALFTYSGAYAWEHYLKRFHYDDDDWEHHVIASVPYLASTLMLTILIARKITPIYASPLQGALGAVLLSIGLVSGYKGVKASGVLALGMGTLSFYLELYNPQAPLFKHPDFLWTLVLFLTAFAASERLFALLQQSEHTPSKLEDRLRTALVICIALIGLLGLYAWASGNLVVFYLLALAVVLISLGAIFRESRYRWAALVLLVVCLIQAFTHFQHLSQGYQVLTFSAAAAVLLAVSWAYSRIHPKPSAKPDSPPKEEPPASHE